MSKAFDRLTLLSTFVRIAEAGSISEAARGLGLSQPAASRQLAELESRLRKQLITRTTHSLTLTEAGAALLVDARAMLGGWEALEERHHHDDGILRGSIHVVAPVAFGQTALARLAAAFLLENPALDVRWELDDRPIRFAEVGCDCWIKIGAVPDDTLIVRELGSVERLLVTAPTLRTGKGPLRTPKAAESLPLVALAPFESGRIPLRHERGTRTTIFPRPRLTTNNIVALKEAVLAGVGMAILPRWFVHDDLASGQLLDLLPRWRAPRLPINVAYPSSRYRPKRLVVFLDFLHRHIRSIGGVEASTLRAID
ncbi:MAG: LysR family transcriptional regulator [Pseudomonadota bacterium]